MLLKTKHLKFITKTCALGFFLCFMTTVTAQKELRDSTLVVSGKVEKTDQATKAKDSTSSFQRYKADGVAAVIGEHLILESDVKKMREDMKNRGVDSEKITDCQLAGRLMEDKLYAHAAKQDSTIYGRVTDARIQNEVDQQINKLSRKIGSMQKLLDYYRKDSETALRDELFKINKERQLANSMQKEIVDQVEITPEEVREFFNSIPEDERPNFGDEVEIAQIVIKPKVPQSQKDKVVQELNDMRDDILNNGASFATKAVLYSEGGTSTKGGKMTITRHDPMDKDFKQIAFSLKEGEISKPFESSFGYHIVKVDRILGQKRQIRHIILMPEVTKETTTKARNRMDSIRNLIEEGEMSFNKAAREYSEEEETRGDGGQLINPETGDTRFELSKIDPKIYNQVNNLKEGEVSKILSDQNRTGKKFYKIITVTDRYPEHIADYSKDYSKIKNLALRDKKMKAIQKWREKEIKDTYVKVNGEYKNCAFEGNWLKK